MENERCGSGSKDETNVQKASHQQEQADTSKDDDKETNPGRLADLFKGVKNIHKEKYFSGILDLFMGKKNPGDSDETPDQSKTTLESLQSSSEPESADQQNDSRDDESTSVDFTEDDPENPLSSSTFDSDSDDDISSASEEKASPRVLSELSDLSDEPLYKTGPQAPKLPQRPCDQGQTSSSSEHPGESSQPSFVKSLLAQSTVETLIYKSIYLKKFNHHLSSTDGPDSDDTDIEFLMSVNARGRQPKRRRQRRPVRGGNGPPRTASRRGQADNPPPVTVEEVNIDSEDSADGSGGEESDGPKLTYLSDSSSTSISIADDSLDYSDDSLEDESDLDDLSEIPIDTEPEFKVPFVSVSELGELDESAKGEKSKSGWECPICYEKSKGQEVVATQCGHVFCKGCLETHFSNCGEMCPSCRTNLSLKPPIVLFNV